MTGATITLNSGAAARDLLGNQSFLAQWLSLHRRCAHATAYQAPGFALPWYETYGAQWQPIVLQSRGENDCLQGLWLLAYDAQTKALVHAGSHQAEYDAWLADPGTDVTFVAGAWAELRRHVAFSALHFKYLPDTSLADTLQAACANDGSGVVVRKLSRPLLRIDAEDIKASFAKKSNKSRFNRLKKLGQLEFRRITDATELERVFDELIGYYDFRQAAVNQSAPFAEDALKRKFHTRLFEAGAGSAYVAATYLNDRPIAGFWGAESGKVVHLCLLMYSPFLAEHSPGKLHVMQLSENMIGEGKEVLDLTPGGDAWKERFANAHDEVAEVVVYNSKRAQLQAGAQDSFMHLAKQSAARVNLTPDEVRAKLASIRGASPSSVVRKLRDWTSVQREYRVYRIDRAHADEFAPDARVQRNCLSDLLSFQAEESSQARDAFLSAALARLEQGASAFTVKLDGRLAHYGWLAANQPELYLAEVDQSLQLPAGSVALYDCYSHTAYRRQGLHRTTLAHMLHAAFARSETPYAYLCVLADNLPCRHIVETMGFDYHGSFHWQCRFGEVKKWADANFAPTETVSA